MLTFTLFLNDQGEILKQLLELYFPRRAHVRIIDLTYGRGALWSTILSAPVLREKYKVTKCDATPAVKGVKKRNLLTDNYAGLGLPFDLAVFDPPYLIGRKSFDYEETSRKSWAAGGHLKKYTTNQTLEIFTRRVECLRDKAPIFLRRGGLLLVKVMDPRRNGELLAHHIDIANILSGTFELVDLGVYTRLGATTWKINGHLQNLHGYWMAFKLRSSALRSTLLPPRSRTEALRGDRTTHLSSQP